ncbi:uncharacterized protein GVI51_G06457 [Nakaseomyces glabratus]|uniref:Uncharacterized protein n=1 Tax=Candida glabrata (strain ATCC 2001 / BCRC 20586 / JCM 3761 / NBRC 0622 / NRRL Y-65 / CBS 138) TaxID=284593 RepID=Q6FSZ5_CANGA|nr:uncharacterized protein CAGL0G06644g [Nakaseomyces glabratus]KAH7603402.1 hypothetical protein J7294_01902 [Nakaseomyces glabratus]KAH7606925.1 hypothetical protein J7293_01898 [Nakaseomyces glabratus]QHS66282.1 uncharacterized protein GVI51_G06457 [Nakaseomyces glabratus]CAG59576.1 unnamed protein product [Nakaseomyces glabratus]|eukprot:XP_446649.1 uncharacterized protein CAGL0G06644g [[Candida] glabrata]
MPNFTGALCNYTISTVVPQTTDCSLPALLLPFSLPRRPSGGPRTTRARIRPTLHSGGTIATASSLLLEAKKANSTDRSPGTPQENTAAPCGIITKRLNSFASVNFLANYTQRHPQE